MTVETNPRAVIGGNNPPPSLYEKAQAETGAIYDEAKLWLDGAAVGSQDDADGIGKLLNLLRATEKSVDAARAEEKRPFDEGAKEVQARYKPLLDNLKRAADACKSALAPWLAKVEAEKRAAAEKTRQEAEAKAREAAEALRASRQAEADLSAKEEAERAIDQAQKAERIAKKAENDTAKAVGGVGRAVSLRTVYRAEIADLSAATWHFLATCPDEMRAAVQKLADDAVRGAGKAAAGMSIPGVIVHEEKKAV